MQKKALLYSIAVTLASFCPAGNSWYRIVLRISRVAVTDYELEKNMAFFSDDFAHKNGHAPAAQDINNWIQFFIDRTYFLADAYEKGYDTLSEVDGWVQSMEHYMVSKKGGLLDIKMGAGSQTTYYDQVKKTAQLKIDPQALSVFRHHLADKKSIRVFDKHYWTSLLPDTLFWYNMPGQTVPVRASRFMDYYNTLPIRKEIQNTEALMFYMESMGYDAVAYRKAEELGITKDPKTVLDRENYKNNVILASYETKELKSGITVSEEEAVKKYGEIKDSLVQATDIVVSTYAFPGRKEAFMGMAALKSRPVDSIGNIKILDRHRSVHYLDFFFSDSIRTLLFSLENNGMTMPMLMADDYIVIVKESESGRRIKTFPEVRSEIVKRIENEKLVRKKEACLARLKTLYAVKDDIDYPKYAGSIKN